MDGRSGLQVVASRVQIDLLVADVGLPGGMTGRQLADAARARRPDLKVLFVTDYAEAGAVGNGLMGRDMEVMAKPFAVDTLLSRV